MQGLLTALIETQEDLEVVGVAQDPYEARDKIKALKPDVITLDVEMPKMDGITFLEKLMRLRPMPVVMVSSLTEINASITLRALELGALDFVTKPKGNDKRELVDFSTSLCEKLREASRTELKPISHHKSPPLAETTTVYKPSSVIAIGASTGGTEAIKEILVRLPSNAPPIVITQHMPEMFTKLFAKRLDEMCSVTVTESTGDERLEAGHVYIAPGGWHMSVVRVGRYFETKLDQTLPVNRHRPSVDVLFHSVAQSVESNAVGVILTGMGRDGADGLGAMKRAGAFTLAQDQASCIVYGMPKVAIEAGYADCVTPLDAIASRMLEALASEQNKSETTQTSKP